MRQDGEGFLLQNHALSPACAGALPKGEPFKSDFLYKLLTHSKTLFSAIKNQAKSRGKSEPKLSFSIASAAKISAQPASLPSAKYDTVPIYSPQAMGAGSFSGISTRVSIFAARDFSIVISNAS